MKFYGYKKKELGKGLMELKEVTIHASPVELREIAEFLLKCADEIDVTNKTQWDHEHFSPSIPHKNTPNLIVSNTKF